ncbi:hypothetical protein [Streptomyces sp. NPDC059008]|uniref:hypothetical protein n=1 Tax=Streptomyces sp. NPDC059008 TaxID=3346693 RepID=UPI0036B65A8A
MQHSINVVSQTTKRVVRKATLTERPEVESNRYYAWQHLLTPQPPQPDAWAGEMAKAAPAFRTSGSLSDVAAKFDHLTRLIEHGAADDAEETDLLAALLVIRTLRDKLLIDEARIIGAARTKSVTWARLADALEMRSRQSAERRYLQIRADIDDASGEPMSQSERVEFIRSQRDRRAERLWADEHHEQIVALARQLVAVPDLQQRANRSVQAARIATQAAEKAGEPHPAFVDMPWPDLLTKCLAASEDQRARRTQLTAGEQLGLTHKLFGLIGYACHPDYVDLSDHDDLVRDIRQLYRGAGAAAPRIRTEYAPHPKPR